ncbi:MAG: RNA polymerase factor sigma-54 [Thermoanaerobaculales bacterium]|nr:RNA polymerase factor sigma-54 [Thermoanaerobaculales bacterium]
MALEQRLNLKLAQRLVMTPSLQQAIKLLQLSRLDLGETLAQEILENPILDVDPQRDDPNLVEKSEGETTVAENPPADSNLSTIEPQAVDEKAPSATDSYDEIDVEAFFADYLGDSRTEGPSMAFRDPSEGSSLENTLSAPPDLYEHLQWQLNLVNSSPGILPVCEFILGNLDEDGFLRASDEEIMRGAGAVQEEVDQALLVVRAMDPPGVGARTLQECFLTQLDLFIIESQDADEEEVEQLQRAKVVITLGWDDLLHQRWDKIKALLDCELNEIKPVLGVIHRLESKPGRMYQHSRNTYIEPDVFVNEEDGKFVISLNEDGLPKLRINSGYSRMLEGSKLDPKVGTYLREKMRSALWLIKSIDQRQRTIFKVAQSIVEYQGEFLNHGIEHLKPMVLRQVAEDIGMHESTISRVVSNKHMYTPRGLFPMKFFFHSSVDSARGGDVSSLVVKDRIGKVIDAEEPNRPLSDSKIMKLLQREGIRLARRTVAKYREELGIASSDKRKKVF